MTMDLYFTQLMIIVIINSVFNPGLKLIYQIENIVVSHCVYISVETLNLTKNTAVGLSSTVQNDHL